MSFLLQSAIATAVVAVLAAALRSKSYAAFRALALTLQSLVASTLWPRVGPLAPLFVYLHASMFVRSLMLVRPRMRPAWYRALVSIPSAFFGAGTAFALPWAIAFALGHEPPGFSIAYLLAAIGTADRKSVV